ncbi:zinc ABC transporter substrate-binding protein [Halomonas meridiana]|uniref:zinc ABC transporter substrate-binding protein n=1 Tax=Vreelandella aquamarina TaxID=77097 RepID=UPI00273B487E|nr:zinc ABC transporter substrate-binding protein [Halomonas meridiana]MDP4557276.1 zinc ABC transporter substrate-binding protein [Halomonas meridiana]
MPYRLTYFALPLLTAFPLATLAEVPRVAVDIPPVYSLVATVMGDVGTPELFIQPGASPHGYSLRPSEASALDSADLVIWVSDSLTPWLEGPVENLAGDSHHLELIDLPGITTLAYREEATFTLDEGQAHEHEHDHEHPHAKSHDHHDHQDHQDHHGHHHSHTGTNPHAWLSPSNARQWLTAIADQLSDLDPDNAATYRDNAAQGQDALIALEQQLQERLAHSADTRFIVFHDAYQYFEEAFNVQAAGAISIGDASAPSPARIEALQTLVNEENIQCVFSEPQFNPQMVNNVFGDTSAYLGVMDPLGVDLTLDAGLYAALLEQLAGEITRCTRAESA